MPLKILPRKCMSVAKEGKVFEQKKLLQPLLDTYEGTKITWISLFLISPTPTVYSSIHFWFHIDMYLNFNFIWKCVFVQIWHCSALHGPHISGDRWAVFFHIPCTTNCIISSFYLPTFLLTFNSIQIY